MNGTLDFRGNVSIEPLVTVTTLTYNSASFLIETLECIANQTYPNIQWIIVDDCSSDNSFELVKEWVNQNGFSCQVIKNEKNLGVCKNLNKALSFAQGVYFTGAPPDDLFSPDKIAKQVEAFEDLDDSFAVVYSDAEVINEHGSTVSESFIDSYNGVKKTLGQQELFEFLLTTNFIPAMAAMRRLNVIRDLGGFDENLKYEDYDMWLRIAKEYRLYYLDRKDTKYRVHGNNLHQAMAKKWADENFKIFLKHLDNDKAAKKIHKYVLSSYKKGSLPEENKQLYLNLPDIPKLLKYALKLNLSFKNYQKLKKVKGVLN